MTVKFEKLMKEIPKKPINLVIYSAILAFVILGILVFSFNSFLNKPASKDEKEVEFVIKSGEDVRKIAKNLETKDLVRDDFRLLVYLKIRGLAGDIKAGVYKLSPKNSPKEIVDILTNGKVASKKITIVEGWTAVKIGQYLEDQGITTKSDFLAATKKTYDYEFLKNLPEGASVEGFLFPDTYQIPYNSTAEDIVVRLLNNFDAKLTTEKKNEIDTSGYNVYQIVTLASIVEREVSKPIDRKMVAGIFLKRLENGYKLQSDVTVNYALGNDKEILDGNDIAIDSPYNTYKVEGIPYGPISNPGIEAIDAVLRPDLSEFIYFLSAGGTTYYSKTFDEHEEKRIRYLNN